MPKSRQASVTKASLSSKMLQLSSNHASRTLLHLRKGDVGILDHIDLPADDARRLMELGFLPGTSITAGQSAPGGDPRVFQVDGSEIALRRATAALLTIRPDSQRTM
jgi:ferrous iron transport protein A